MLRKTVPVVLAVTALFAFQQKQYGESWASISWWCAPLLFASLVIRGNAVAVAELHPGKRAYPLGYVLTAWGILAASWAFLYFVILR